MASNAAVSSSLVGQRLSVAAPIRVNAISKRSGAAVRASAGDAASESVRQFALRALHEKKAFKVIAGLNNFDAASVAAVVAAAEKGGATHVDIACDADLVRLALSLSSMPVCVSAVDPALFLPAVAAGAHMIEIGNFDSFYPLGQHFSADDVLALTRATRALLPSVALSVTVPHTLPLHEQVALAEALAANGADIIQTEGGTSAEPRAAGVVGLMQKAAPTLAAAHAISRAVSLPVICASGLSSVTAPLALAAGAAGVGVGSAINRLNDPIAMVAAVREIADAIADVSSISKREMAGRS